MSETVDPPQRRHRSWLYWSGLLRSDPDDILSRVYQVAVVVRGLLGLHAVFVNTVLVLPIATRPWIIWVACVVIIVWTLFVSERLINPEKRTLKYAAIDAAVTAMLVLATPLAVPAGGAELTLAGYWAAAAPLYAAIFSSPMAGVVSSLVVSVGLFIVPSHVSWQRAGMSFIIILVAASMGILVRQFRNTLAEQEQQRMKAAALAERERLSRIVHDGALQVLALVEREGPALGHVGVRLAALARESESQLRALLQDREVKIETDSSHVDLAGALDKFASARVTVSTMAGEVLVPKSTVAEIEATLKEIFKNVERHAGAEAQVWVLLDQEVDDEAIIWVRDNGVGMDARAARQAAEEGRFGIRDSIIGRISAIGGSAILKSAPGAGTEWELRIPIDME
ncbi:sensor histidine kinase [Tessaracoccus sp. OH4464_COT-324]|uniref:sensor histidine kinase n=1 Tax=Tessaracoccus sp. OH4464_COT-324 TaxID=2491059 RepID=UPI000F63EAC7|nr:ATP-binding protein [Tessaracoccus sp. OH4464_COT-324]RRD45749.1 hypothetical protein EII42_10115 [Tessaracoccus sp. OH4464_COT-324]